VGFPAIVTILIQLKKLNATPDISAESPIIPIGDVNEELKIYHDYYPWVPLVFGLSGIFFYLPRMLWKKKERLHGQVHQGDGICTGVCSTT
jgi:hypothetical protein